MWEDDGELTDDELEFFDPPKPEPNYRGPSKRKPRERVIDERTGKKIAKRDLKVIQKGGKKGPKVQVPGKSKEFPIATAAQNIPLDPEIQKKIFSDIREGYQEQTAVEGNGVSMLDWIQWKSDSPAFADRVEMQKSPKARDVEDAIIAAATGKVAVKKVTTKVTHAYLSHSKEGTELVELDEPTVMESVIEKKELAADIKAQQLYLNAHGREGFRQTEAVKAEVNINILGGNDTLSADDREMLGKLAGKREVIEAEGHEVE